jgi:AsmA protein
VVSEISIEEPTASIRRYKDGTFNFDTLAVMTQKSSPAVQQETGTEAVALPIALTVDRIRIKQARFSLKDDLGEIPDTEMQTDLNVSIKLGQDLSSLQYKGDLSMIMDAVYGEMKPHLEGKGGFDQDNLNLTMDIKIGEEKVKLDGNVKNYTTAPNIILDVSSKKLDIDYLLAAVAGLPKTGQKEKKSPPAEKSSSSGPLPPGLEARGKVQVEQALYKGTKVNDFKLSYTLLKGILTIQDFTAKIFGGEAKSSMMVDLNNPDISYDGKIALQDVQMKNFASAFAQKAQDIFSGSLQTSFNFSGTGTEWSMIRNTLSAAGGFSVLNGRIQNTPITKTIASLINLPELDDVSFQDISGEARLLKGGKVELQSQMNSPDIMAKTQGTIGLDGTLNLPLTLNLSPALSQKLGAGTSVAKYLANEKGETVLNIKLAGTAASPRPTLDTAGIQKQAVETLQGKALEAIGGSLDSDKTKEGAAPGNEVDNLLKGLFNR